MMNEIDIEFCEYQFQRLRDDLELQDITSAEQYYFVYNKTYYYELARANYCLDQLFERIC